MCFPVQVKIEKNSEKNSESFVSIILVQFSHNIVMEFIDYDNYYSVHICFYRPSLLMHPGLWELVEVMGLEHCFPLDMVEGQKSHAVGESYPELDTKVLNHIMVSIEPLP